MSEATAIDEEEDSVVSCLVSEMVDSSCEKVFEQTESNDEQESSALEQITNEEASLEFVANVDVTIDSDDFHSNSSSRSVCEGRQGKNTEDETVEEDGKKLESGDEDGKEELESEELTATCSLLGLEHAKV